MAKGQVFAPKGDVSAEWSFFPSAKVRKSNPSAEVEFLGLEAQAGEILLLTPKSQKMLNGTMVLEIAEGRVELVDAKANWESRAPSKSDDDAIVWDVDRMLEAWASDE